jgi:hypothetical protein
MGTSKKCFNWVKKIMLACPECLAVEYYDEFVIKKGKGVIECRKCHAKFSLGYK